MKELNKIAFVFLLLFQFSCRQTNLEQTEIKEFPKTNELFGTLINDIRTQEISSIRIIDTILVILNREGDFFFEYYRLKDFKLLGKYGNKGKGPGEFLYPEFTGDIINRSNNRTFLKVFDWHRKSIILVDLYKSINNNSYEYESLELSKKLKNGAGVIFNNDSKIGMIPDHKLDSRFLLYDIKNDSIIHIPFVPKLTKGKISTKNQYYLYATGGNCVYKDQFFIAAPSGNGQLDFFDLNGKYIKTIHIRDNDYLKEARHTKSVMDIEGFNVFYSDVQILNNKIYSLFSIVKLPDLTSILKSRIYVFDIDGNPKKEYILDKEIHKFAIDTVNKRFIGLLTNEGNLVSFSYE